MRISIVGSGVLGKVTGVGFVKHGNHVIFHDIVKEKLATLREQGFETTEDKMEAIMKSNLTFVCVQTPILDGRMDLSYVEKAIVKIAQALRKKKEYHVVVIRSTVLPSITRTQIIPLLTRYSRLTPSKDYSVCVNPGFFRHSSALNDFLKPSRIVIGELDKQSGDLLEKLYTPFTAPIFRTDLDTAEMIKCAANTFLSAKISFFNEMFTICRSLGVDPHFISEVVALDPRIGKYGIYGGRPFEGPCLPKDLEAFINFVKDRKHNPKLLDAVLHINEEMARMRASKGEIR